MNYSQIWEKIENLPWCALVTSGRHGSDYFQSLLDSHPEVFVFNGVLFFHNRFWVESSCINFQGELNTGNREAFIAYQEEIAISDLVNEFIGKYIYKFKSKYDHDENKHQLGESRQESIDIDLTEFHTHCVGLARQRPLSSRNFLQAIYTAYALCLGQDIMKKKLFFHHIHRSQFLDDYLRDFPESKIISMTRDPRASYVSGVESFRRFNPLEDTPWRVFFTLNRTIEDAQPLKKYPNEYRILRLETLEDQDILKEVCKWLNISYHPSLKQSTWNGLRWWGDQLSVQPKQQDHVQYSNAIRRNNWKHKLNLFDKLIFSYLFKERLKLFEYEFEEKKGLGWGVLIWFAMFLPTTYEQRHFSPQFQLKWLRTRKYGNILRSFYYYFKRIVLFNKLFYKVHFGEKFEEPVFRKEHEKKMSYCLSKKHDGPPFPLSIN